MSTLNSKATPKVAVNLPGPLRTTIGHMTESSCFRPIAIEMFLKANDGLDDMRDNDQSQIEGL